MAIRLWLPLKANFLNFGKKLFPFKRREVIAVKIAVSVVNFSFFSSNFNSGEYMKCKTKKIAGESTTKVTRKYCTSEISITLRFFLPFHMGCRQLGI